MKKNQETIDSNSADFSGQWGVQTSDGQEIWWSGVHARLFSGRRIGRLRFWSDFRHFMTGRMFKIALEALQIQNSTSQRKLNVIDFGCGTGGSTLNFSYALGLSIQGYDVFEKQIAIAREIAQTHTMQDAVFGVIENGRIPLQNEGIDILMSSDVLGHVAEIPATLDEWNRVLSPGGFVVLYTEADYSREDSSLMATIKRDYGFSMIGYIPTHISLYPKAQLDAWFLAAGFEIIRSWSGNVLHAFFNPSEFLDTFKKVPPRGRMRLIKLILQIWNRLNKLIPFYPVPLHWLRIGVTLIFGTRAYGCNYFYLLRKITSKSSRA